MLSIESASCTINEAHQGDDFAIRPNLLATFDGVSSENSKGSETKHEFLRQLDSGKSIPEALEAVIRESRHKTTVALVSLTPENRLEIYRIGDSRVRIQDQEGKLVYQTNDQNLHGEIRSKMGLIHTFYERDSDKIFEDIQTFPELRQRLITICNQFITEESALKLFDAQTVRRLLDILGKSDAYLECMREIKDQGFSLTLLKHLYDQSAEFLSYCLGDPESLAFTGPVKTMEAKPGYRIVIGTDGVFVHLKESLIRDLSKMKTVNFAARALAYEAIRKNRRKADVTTVVANLIPA